MERVECNGLTLEELIKQLEDIKSKMNAVVHAPNIPVFVCGISPFYIYYGEDEHIGSFASLDFDDNAFNCN